MVLKVVCTVLSHSLIATQLLFLLFQSDPILKYVGVQSWKATHLPTLDIRVEQKGSLVMKKIRKNC